MTLKNKLVLGASGALLVGGVLILRRPHEARPQDATVSLSTGAAGQMEVAAKPEAPAAAPTSKTTTTVEPTRREPPAPARPPAVPEAALMTTLRELGAADPARALELAREGNRRFPKSADAAERAWTICKSLAALGRFPEAQQEARQMVQRYPDSSWASDVQRHLLDQPGEDPGQRGYGRSSEID